MRILMLSISPGLTLKVTLDDFQGDSNVRFTLKITFKAENVIFNVLETFPSHFFGFVGIT